MNAILLRTGSGQMTMSSLGSSSPTIFPGHDSGAGFSFSMRSGATSPRTSLHFQARDSKSSPIFRRARSETNLVWAEISGSGAGSGLRRSASIDLPSPSNPRRSVKEDLEARVGILQEEEVPAVSVKKSPCMSGMVATEEALTELSFGGAGGNGGKSGGRSGGSGGNKSSSGGGSEQRGVGDYYKEMVKSNPKNPLLLRNYGKYLHEVEKDAVKAEEYYGRAILESPADGEVLSLYASLIWDTHRDEQRAENYFEQAIKASPDDCYVLASYAHFLWDAKEEDEDIQDEKVTEPSPLIAAY